MLLMDSGMRIAYGTRYKEWREFEGVMLASRVGVYYVSPAYG